MKRLLTVLSAAVLLASCTGATLAPERIADAFAGCEAFSPPKSIDGPAETALRLIALGDAGLAPDDEESHLEETLAAMQAIPDVDGILLLGDNVYDCGVESVNAEEWTTVIAPLLKLGKPVFPVLGNHDWGRRAIHSCSFSRPEAEIAKSGQPGFERWIFPDASYILRTPVAEFILYDSTPMAEALKDEIQRPLCALRTALSAKKALPWRIVAAHHPLFSCGAHGDDPETSNVRLAVEPLLQRVDLYVAGHDHNLEIRTEGTGSPVYLISGSGAKIRPSSNCEEGPDFQIDGGFAVLDISAEELKIRVFCNGQETPCMERRLTPSE